MPRCLWVTTLSIKLPQKVKAGELQRIYLEKNYSFVFFLAVNLTFHFDAQDSILLRSLLRIEVVSEGSSPVASNDVSAANKRILDSISNWLPCGHPDVMFTIFDDE